MTILTKFVVPLLIAAAFPATALAAVVNINVTSAQGTTTPVLAAGTYKVNFVGVLNGGATDAFSYWTDTSGCNSNGADCARGWTNHFAIDFGSGGTNFARTDGVGYGLATVGGFRQVYQTPALSLAAYSTQFLHSASLPSIYSNANASTPANYFMAGGNAYTTLTGPVMFTLAAAQSVNFFVVDFPHGDNRGGVSLQVSAVPEPTTWAMMIGGFGIAGMALRRRRAKVRVSFA